MSVLSRLINAVHRDAPTAPPAPTDGDETKHTPRRGNKMPPQRNEGSSADELEDQILRLLDTRGGRIWQQDAVSETEYSAATISRRLTEMEENGQIARYWIKNQKVVADPELIPGGHRERLTEATCGD